MKNVKFHVSAFLHPVLQVIQALLKC